MTSLLLQTKLFRPVPRPALIARPHLIHRLNEGLAPITQSAAARLALVSAPAGFGKTMLAAAWLAQLVAGNAQASSPAIAWLSLDDGDNDMIRFLTYLVVALQTAIIDLGEAAVRALQSAQPPPAETILTMLINDVTVKGTPIVLVLDDYHVISTPSIHRALTFLLDHLPPPLHLLMTTRSDPPLPLARLRARGQLLELRAADLRFSFQEVRTFFHEVMGLPLLDADVTALAERTEGWIAGLQMAALSMQGRDDLPSLVAAYGGSHRFILDYLTDEVLERRPAGTRRFLLQTSILDRFCGPLCDAVTGQSGGQATLERLEQANLFLIPLDEERHWYRYHHLFAEVLRNRLQGVATSAEEEMVSVYDLHLRASGWFEQEGLIDEAIRHALTAPDIERAGCLVEQHSLKALQRSEVLLIRTWLEQLPAEFVLTRPRLILAYGWVLAFTGQSRVAKKWLETPQAVTALGATELAEDIRGELAVLQATIGRFLHENEGILAFAQEALRSLPEERFGLRAGAMHLMGVAQFRQGDTDAARRSFAEAAALGASAEGPYMALIALQDLASIQIRQGQLAQMKRTCQEAMGLVTRWGGPLLPAAGMAYIDYGGALYEQNDLHGATQALTQGIGLLRGSTEHYLLAEGYTLLARVRQAQGEVEGVVSAIAQGEAWFNQVQVDDLDSKALLALGQARLWLAQGNVQAAARWAQKCQWRAEDTHLGYHQAVTLLRLQLAQSRGEARAQPLEETAAIAERLLAVAEGREWWGYVIELSLLRALLCQQIGDVDGALGELGKALSMAEPHGYCRIFLDEGEAMADLLRQARQRGLSVQYVDRLLRLFASREGISQPKDLLPEPLSERELEVLRLAAAGASNKEIAAELFIALSTVKKHMGNILMKLDAQNRVQAVTRGRELGLL